MRRCTRRFQLGNTPSQQRAHACDVDSWPSNATHRTLRTPPRLQAAHPQSVAPATNRHQPVSLLVRQSPTVPSWAAMVRCRGECVQWFRQIALRKTGSPNVYELEMQGLSCKRRQRQRPASRTRLAIRADASLGSNRGPNRHNSMPASTQQPGRTDGRNSHEQANPLAC